MREASGQHRYTAAPPQGRAAGLTTLWLRPEKGAKRVVRSVRNLPL